jgi:hemerythrin superfamily protein
LDRVGPAEAGRRRRIADEREQEEAVAQEKELPHTDAIQLLESDHRAVEQLFRSWTEVTPEEGPTVKRSLVEQMVTELSVHAAIEEQVFYPAVREALLEGHALVEHSLEEHQEAKELLAELEGMQPGDLGYEEKVGTLIAEVREHVEEEEGTIFPKLREAIGQVGLNRIGEALERAKKTAPTHPHPRGSATPPANVLAGPPVAAVDRARDVMTGRSGRSRAIVIAAVTGVVVLLVIRALAKRRS